MKRLLWLLLLVSVGASAQQVFYGAKITSGTGAPTGSCDPNALYVNSSNGNIYACAAGTWTLSGGGGSSVSLTATAPIVITPSPTTGTGVVSATTQGTDSKLLTAGTVSGTAATLCTDANGGATTSGCPSGAGGSLESHTASSSATLNFTSCLSSTYDEYDIIWDGIVPATDAANLELLFSTNGGSSYATSGYSTLFLYFYPGNTANYGLPTGGTASTTAVLLDQTSSTASNGGASGSLRIFGVNGSSNKMLRGQSVHYQSSTSTFVSLDIAGTYNSSSVVNAFQLKFDSGNIASGTVRCYGISH